MTARLLRSTIVMAATATTIAGCATASPSWVVGGNDWDAKAPPSVVIACWTGKPGVQPESNMDPAGDIRVYLSGPERDATAIVACLNEILGPGHDIGMQTDCATYTERHVDTGIEFGTLPDNASDYWNLYLAGPDGSRGQPDYGAATRGGSLGECYPYEAAVNPGNYVISFRPNCIDDRSITIRPHNVVHISFTSDHPAGSRAAPGPIDDTRIVLVEHCLR